MDMNKNEVAKLLSCFVTSLSWLPLLFFTSKYGLHSIFHPSILLFSNEKFTPMRYSFRWSIAKGLAYPLSSICCRASSGVPSSLNSTM